jgi:hypothetical protein
MKRTILITIAYLLCLGVRTQTITLVKDTFVRNTLTDSMYYISEEKIIPFKDSGVVVVGYADSIVNGQSAGFRVIVTAFDKNLNSLWTYKFPFSTSYSTLSAITDADYTTYLTFFLGSQFILAVIDSNGSLILNKPIQTQISTTTIPIINSLALYHKHILLSGNIFYTRQTFAPFLALFDMNGNLYRKKVLPTCSSSGSVGLYACSLLNITSEDNIAFTYELDSFNNYVVACYDSLFTKIWSSGFNTSLSYGAYNLFNQGSNVIFINNTGNTPDEVGVLKFDSKTGAGGTENDHTYSFIGNYPSLFLPTRNGKYLSFGNYSTSAGFDNAIDYFDDNQEIAFVGSNTYNSRNRVSSACIIGNMIYTVTVRFVDAYCYPAVSNFYRGVLWIKKFNTDFLNQGMGVKNITDETGDRLTVYPNPFTDELCLSGIDFTGTGCVVKIYDELGRSQQVDYRLTNHIIRLDTGALPGGIYFVEVQNNNAGELKRYKVMK